MLKHLTALISSGYSIYCVSSYSNCSSSYSITIITIQPSLFSIESDEVFKSFVQANQYPATLMHDSPVADVDTVISCTVISTNAGLLRSSVSVTNPSSESSCTETFLSANSIPSNKNHIVHYLNNR